MYINLLHKCNYALVDSSCFLSVIHIKIIKKSKAKKKQNMLTILGLWSNTMFRVLRFRNVNIHCKIEQLSQKSEIKLVFN